ncbi:MAG: ABC transporter permease subunit [Planctomycetota bacterium]
MTTPAQSKPSIGAHGTGQPRRHERRTPASAHGEPAVWLMGGSLALCLVLIGAMLALIVVRGGATFWQGPAELLELDDGSVFAGVPVDTFTSPAGADERDWLAERLGDDWPSAAGERGWMRDGELVRRRYRTGNRDLGDAPSRIVPLYRIVSSERPDDLAVVERRAWGVFLGRVEAFGEVGEAGVFAPVEVSRSASTWDRFEAAQDEADARLDRVERLNTGRIPALQSRLAGLGWDASKIDLRARRAAEREPISAVLWGAALLAGAAGVIAAIGLGRRATVMELATPRRLVRTGEAMCWCAAIALALLVALEHPWSARAPEGADRAAAVAELAEREAQTRDELERVLGEISALQAEDARFRVIVREYAGERFAPLGQADLREPMLLSDVTRVVYPNRLGLLDKVGLYVQRWGTYLSEPPRANGSEGGVWPVIVGTVVLTMLLTVSVVPFGVIAAIYLREYAHQGVLTSLIRIAINNLAGVPSIVYGMFGLGFFCYALGGYIDAGPVDPISRGTWWGLLAVVGLLVGGGALLAMLGSARPGRPATRLQSAARSFSWVFWIGCVALAFVLIARTPYFGGFFAEKLPQTPTFGGRGILWASLTLALLTLPVVIVATEEAIAAVPNSMREGSLASGATRWQTIRKIVLPAATPGIITGAILAMARGAGEVAPLMLVGAVNFAPGLPVSGEAPFLHGDRTFMHLGFHIYNLGFQSPDAEATEPLVWTTTLLLITIVLALNLAAMWLRTRLRARTGTPAI